MSSQFVLAISLLATALISGCASTGKFSDDGQFPCGANLLQAQVGARVESAVDGITLVGGKAVHAPGLVRVFASGDPVTHDFRADRLNLETDRVGKLVRASCG